MGGPLPGFGVRKRNGHVASWSLVSREFPLFLLISARILVSLGYAIAGQRRDLTLRYGTMSKMHQSFDGCSLVGHDKRNIFLYANALPLCSQPLCRAFPTTFRQ